MDCFIQQLRLHQALAISHSDGDLPRRRGGGDLWTYKQRAPYPVERAQLRFDHMQTEGAEKAADGIKSGLKSTHEVPT
jgi:hypothetical protein